MPEDTSMSIEEATRTLTAPGQMFEMEEVEIRGVSTRVWKNCPANLATILELSRGHGDTRLPRLRGRAHHLRGELPHRRHPRPGTAGPVRGRAR